MKKEEEMKNNQDECKKSFDQTWVFADGKKKRKIHVKVNLHKTNKPRIETFKPYINQIIKDILEG